jgi:hypothetical protein
MSTADTPIPPAELALWGAAVTALEECDKAAGITDPGTVNARAAFGRFAAANGRRS